LAETVAEDGEGDGAEHVEDYEERDEDWGVLLAVFEVRGCVVLAYFSTIPCRTCRGRR
jgi:hypothetical protein